MMIDPAIRRALVPRLFALDVSGRKFFTRQWTYRDWAFLYRRRLWATSLRTIADAGSGVWDESGNVVDPERIPGDQLPTLVQAIYDANGMPDPVASILGADGDILIVKSAGVELHMRRLTREQQLSTAGNFGLSVSTVCCDSTGRAVFEFPQDISHLAAAPLVGVGRLAAKLAREEFGPTPQPVSEFS